MAHEIGEMFWHGAVPWHGLGRHAPHPLTLDEALAQGGLDWDVRLVPIVTADGALSPAPHRMAVVREDRAPKQPGRVVGVVHPAFRPLQNREGGELFDRLFDPGTRKYHTGGYLRNGEVVWLLARLPEDIHVGGDDVVETYLLYSNSHDGSQPIDIRLTTVRVVCRNTLSFALNGRSARAFRWRHRDDPSVVEREARAFLQLTTAQVRESQQAFASLAKRPCDDDAFRRFLAALVPDPAPVSVDSSRATVGSYEARLAKAVEARAAIERIRVQGLSDRDIPADEPTWWGAVNAVTAWVDHAQAVKGDRYAHALFGAGDRMKTKAYALATATAGVARGDTL
jgi:phage/plasmid-like protein (TIGR03299 family)